MRRKERGVQLQRILGLVFFLADRYFGATIAEMLEETGFPRRTLYRDLAMIEGAGLQFRKERVPAHGTANRWRLVGVSDRLVRLAGLRKEAV